MRKISKDAINRILDALARAHGLKSTCGIQQCDCVEAQDWRELKILLEQHRGIPAPSESDYNGWSNRATWNVSLWLNNDEGCYHDLCRAVRHAHNVKDLAKRIEQLCNDTWENGVTPDDDPLSEADFDEIAAGEWADGRAEDDPETGEPLEGEADNA